MEQIPGEELERYFLRRLPAETTSSEVLDLLFLVMERKPGALVMGADSSTVSVLKEFCSRFELQMKVVRGEKRSLLDRLLGRDTRFFRDCVFLAWDENRFDILEAEDGKFCETTDRAAGNFLGYPESAVEYYVEKTVDGPIGADTEELVEEMIEDGVLDDDDRVCLELLSYVPRPEEEEVLEAVREGRERRAMLKELDSYRDVSVGSYYLKRVCGEKH
ncbi:MAG: hypothetical protein ABEJ69_03960 [Candidatus Nanohaloarchaea archaeon]